MLTIYILQQIHIIIEQNNTEFNYFMNETYSLKNDSLNLYNMVSVLVKSCFFR